MNRVVVTSALLRGGCDRAAAAAIIVRYHQTLPQAAKPGGAGSSRPRLNSLDAGRVRSNSLCSDVSDRCGVVRFAVLSANAVAAVLTFRMICTATALHCWTLNDGDGLKAWISVRVCDLAVVLFVWFCQLCLLPLQGTGLDWKRPITH